MRRMTDGGETRPEPGREGLTRRQRWVDFAIALALFAFALAVLFDKGFGEASPDTREGDALGVFLVGLLTLPLAFRRVAPLAAFLASATAMFPIHALEYPGELGLMPAIALYQVSLRAADDPRRARLLAAVAAAIFLSLAAVAVFVADTPDLGILAGAAVWLAAWVAGDRTRLRRQRMLELHERAAQAEREAERERRLSIAEERTRIARDLHDSAGHAINVILVQAAAARLLRERDPARSEDALETIEDVARSTLGEIDDLVRALREDDHGSRTSEDGLPVLSVDGIEGLAETQRAAGLEVSTRIEGDRRTVPRGVDGAAYRIVQEALTNAARHGAGTAEVAIRFGDHALEVTVTNPIGPAVEQSLGGGQGLVGMRERAQLLGGRLAAGADDGLWRVRAELPYDRAVR
jgi:signal transduction histidine kinase